MNGRRTGPERHLTLPSSTATRLEKAALESGFDLALPAEDDWLAFASSRAPLAIRLTQADSMFLAALSQPHVARALDELAQEATAALPAGFESALSVPDLPTLHRLLRRAFQLSRTLPDQLLRSFQAATLDLPRATEVERLRVERIGQDLFRAGLIEYWQGRCPLSGLATTELLRASHIKPWALCGTDAERLDIFNGLLLAPHLDAAFDRGFLTFDDDGAILVSPLLTSSDRQALGLDRPMRLSGLAVSHRTYLAWHRGRVFRR